MAAESARPGERQIVILVLIGLGVLAVSRGALESEHLWYFAAAIPSIILHEVSHGAVANVFGDPTAKRAGRLTLNPIAHVDLFGTLIMPAMLVFAGAPAFGFAKPVPVNVSNLRSPRNHSLFVGLAGPATNIVLALAAALTYRLTEPTPFSAPWEFLVAFGGVNVVLAIFNMLPIPPLDGSALIERALPNSLYPAYLKFRRFSMPLIIVLVFAFPGFMARLYEPVLDLWGRVAAG